MQSSIITDNVEALAQFLIRRAQVKGQYELPGRGAQGGGEKLQGKRVNFQVLLFDDYLIYGYLDGS